MLVSDLEYFHMCIEREIIDAIQASCVLDYTCLFFEANKQLLARDPDQSLPHRALCSHRDLRLLNIGEMLKQHRSAGRLDGVELRHEVELKNHRDYLGHGKMKIGPFSFKRMRRFAKDERHHLDFKAALVWQFWQSLVTEVDREGNAAAHGRVISRPHLRVTAEIQSMAHHILTLAARVGSAPPDATSVAGGLVAFGQSYAASCDSSDPIRRFVPWTDAEAEANMAERKRVYEAQIRRV